MTFGITGPRAVAGLAATLLVACAGLASDADPKVGAVFAQGALP